MYHRDAGDNDDQICNPSQNQPFAEVLRCYLSRREVLIGTLALGVSSFLPPLAGARPGPDRAQEGADRGRLIGFEPVSVADGSGPWPAISQDYRFEVLIPWGEPLEPQGPAFRYPPNAADQAVQVGIGHDGMWFFPFADGGSEHGLLAVNHEFGRNRHVLGKSRPDSLADVRVSQHAHGVSIVEIKKIQGRWRPVTSEYARRIHVNTPMTFSGPAAGHPLLQTKSGNAALGTVNNCSSGPTPWGTYLTCEENVNGYFGVTDGETSWAPTPEQARYGFSEDGFGYGWHRFDRRFDLSDRDFINEENRFGWVVEIDPFDPTQTPVKRTALGRFKHEGATTVIGKDGRVVVYMGDDQRFDYIYKFVSAGPCQRLLEQGRSPLDEGSLYVARFHDDGTGEWLELSVGNPVLARRFRDQAEVLTYARVAADLLGATPMDRPEWTSVAPDGTVYCTLTNNGLRIAANAANPLAPNLDGHIIRWRDTEEFTGSRFTWDIFLIARDSHGTEHTFSDPDGIWADPDGRLFIETDGDQPGDLNNQLLVADTGTGALARLFTGVTGCEVTGLAVTPDRRTLFCNIQHPGNGDPTRTNFPARFDGETVPRDATIVITRKDGGIVGS